MNKNHTLIILLCLFCFAFGANAQDLGTLTSQIKAQITPVQTGSKTYEIKFEPMEAGLIQYGFDEIDSKGKKTTMLYEFNLADIDPYAVREQTQKDAIYAVLSVRNKQKLVKVYKDGEVQPYDNEVSIIVKDIESARAITDAVKKAIPLAEKEVTGRLKVSGYDAMVNWLTANVKEVSLGTKTSAQLLSKGEKVGTLVFKEVLSDGKSSSEEIFMFNLADLNVNTIAFKVTGNRFAINVETLKKDKYIAVRKNGEVKPFVSEITINTNGVDEARDIKTVLTQLIPLAVEKVKADIPTVNSASAGLQNIKAGTTDLKVGAKQVTQQLEAECICKFTQTESDAKSTESNVYKFNWMDFNPTFSAITVSGDKLFIELQVTDKRKMVMHTKNDKFDGYESELKLYMTDIESARRVKASVDKVIEKCKASYKEPFGADAGQAIAWLKDNIKEVTLEDVTIKQSLDQVEAGKNDKLKFTARELNAKGTGAEEVYEFNLADVNPLSIEIAAKGKWLYVTMESEFKNKIFNFYKDGKIQPYASKIEFAVNDTELARNVVGAFKKAVTSLKGK